MIIVRFQLSPLAYFHQSHIKTNRTGSIKLWMIKDSLDGEICIFTTISISWSTCKMDFPIIEIIFQISSEKVSIELVDVIITIPR